MKRPGGKRTAKRPALSRKPALKGNAARRQRPSRKAAAQPVRKRRTSAAHRTVRTVRRKGRPVPTYRRAYNTAFDRAYNEGFTAGFNRGMEEGLSLPG